MKKEIVFGAIVGVLLTITVGSVWLLWRQEDRINKLEIFALQVSQLINNANQTK